jgi:hypothetical protein
MLARADALNRVGRTRAGIARVGRRDMQNMLVSGNSTEVVSIFGMECATQQLLGCLRPQRFSNQLA